MIEQNKQVSSAGRVEPDERFHYIGFEVFPGKAGDIFTSESEKAKLVGEVRQKRSKRDLLREQCSLVMQRVSSWERMALVGACVVVFFSVFMPWYSAYNEVIEQPTQSAAVQTDQAGEEVITSAVVRKKSHKIPFTLYGFETITKIGTVGGAMFSSGPVLIFTALIMLAYMLMALALPVYVLMALFKKTKESTDEAALRLKKLLRLGWYPVILFVSALVLSFLGADYVSGVAEAISSLGKSYGPGVFLGTLSWGMFVALGGFLVLATKGIEI